MPKGVDLFHRSEGHIVVLWLKRHTKRPQGKLFPLDTFPHEHRARRPAWCPISSAQPKRWPSRRQVSRSVERRNGTYVMAGTASIISGCRDAQAIDHSRRTTDGPQDRSGVSWLQLLDTARPRAQRTRTGRSDPQSESTRRSHAAPHPDRFARPGLADRTMEGGKQPEHSRRSGPSPPA